jgi:hypothetical protein
MKMSAMCILKTLWNYCYIKHKSWAQEKGGCYFFCCSYATYCCPLVFTYYDCVFFPLDSYLLKKLRVAFNAYVRYVYLIFDHIFDVADSILGCFLLTYMVFWLACFISTVVTVGRSFYLFESLAFSCFKRT